jgi:septal ring factor EnvC (AmiA/AmiB activator)
MHEHHSELILYLPSLFCLIDFIEQLMALIVEPGDQDSTSKSLTALKSKLLEEKAARGKAQTEAETLAWAIDDLKKMVDRFTAQVIVLEDRVKHLDNMVLDELTELHAKELNLERTTKANENYKS